MEQTNQIQSKHAERFAERFQRAENVKPMDNVRACRTCQRNLEQATDRLNRANRDLGETAAFVVASLTTVTAIEAVINIAVDRIKLGQEVLQVAFLVYIAVFMSIFIWGAIQSLIASHRRARAERDIDQAKRGIFEYCGVDPAPKAQE